MKPRRRHSPRSALGILRPPLRNYHRPLGCERLEHRRLLATFYVPADYTLAAALSDAQSNSDTANTILLADGSYPAPQAVINVASGRTLSIVGHQNQTSGTGGQTIIDANQKGRVFEVSGFDGCGGGLVLQDLTITGGLATDSGQVGGLGAFGGGLLVDGGNVTLIRVNVTGNMAQGADGEDGVGPPSYGGPLTGGNGAMACGGGIYVNKGVLVLNNCNITQNWAIGGNGGDGDDGVDGADGDSSGTAGDDGQDGQNGQLGGAGGAGGNAEGGGVWLSEQSTQLTIVNCDISDNTAQAGAGGGGGAGGAGGDGGDGGGSTLGGNGGEGGSGGFGGEGGRGGDALGGGLICCSSSGDLLIQTTTVNGNSLVAGAGGPCGAGGDGGDGGPGQEGGWGGNGGGLSLGRRGWRRLRRRPEFHGILGLLAAGQLVGGDAHFQQHPGWQRRHNRGCRRRRRRRKWP